MDNNSSNNNTTKSWDLPLHLPCLEKQPGPSSQLHLPTWPTRALNAPCLRTLTHAPLNHPANPPPPLSSTPPRYIDTSFSRIRHASTTSNSLLKYLVHQEPMPIWQPCCLTHSKIRHQVRVVLRPSRVLSMVLPRVGMDSHNRLLHRGPCRI